MQPAPHDRHGRPLGVLRLSLTARCNLACPYCLPDGTEPPGLLSALSGPPAYLIGAEVLAQPGDGSCLFHSLAAGLADGSTGASLRADAAEHRPRVRR